jgi:hypothetical protein
MIRAAGGSPVDTFGWVPMRWPCGPLEIERGKRREGFSAREAEALREWCEPRVLERLEGSPVNCLVVSWADGSAGDESQQRALAPLVAAARQRGLAVVGWVADTADLRRAAGAAQTAGLSALASESREPLPGMGVLRFRERGLADRSASDFLGVAGLVWPGLRVTEAKDADASTGPTGPPWLDSNAWYVRLAKCLVDPRQLWLAFDPPEIGQPVAAASYVQAIADTEIYGGRWLVSLDPHLRLGLAQGHASALETWAAIGRGLAFFRKQRAWTGYVPVGQIGVVSDYAGPNEFLSFEVLNLLARQGGLYRILETHRAAAGAPGPASREASLDGLDAVLYVDPSPPEADLVRRLYAFAEAGGTLITPPGWEERGTRDDDAWPSRFRVSRHGRGRLAVAREDFADPYLLAEDAQLLTSHRHDRLRAFNPGTTQLHYGASEDGRAGVLHALLYETPNPRLPLSLWFREPWAQARVWSIGAEAASPAPRTAAEPGVEFQPPALPVYFALELST